MTLDSNERLDVTEIIAIIVNTPTETSETGGLVKTVNCGKFDVIYGWQLTDLKDYLRQRLETKYPGHRIGIYTGEEYEAMFSQRISSDKYGNDPLSEPEDIFQPKPEAAPKRGVFDELLDQAILGTWSKT